VTRKTEERRLLLQLQDTHGYRLLEMARTNERTIGVFIRRGSRMTYETSIVVRLVVPAKSWLGSEMQAKRGRKTPAKRANKRRQTAKGDPR
jgi:hypothetical protein